MPYINTEVSTKEAIAIEAIIKYMRRPGKHSNQIGTDFPKYADTDSFIRLADEARDAKEKE